MMTDPDVNHVRRCLEVAEFLVLEEIFPSETSQFADVLLPGAAWATERGIQLIQKALEAPGNACPDWTVIAALARQALALEGRAPLGPQAHWAYTSPMTVLDEIAAITPSYGGVSYTRLAPEEPLHWPVPRLDHPGTPLLHVGHFTRGNGKFYACEQLPAEELPDDDYPLYLTTGRALSHWHGGEMTRRGPGLLDIYPRVRVEIRPEDAVKIGLHGQQRVRVVSRRGEVVASVVITARVAPGEVVGVASTAGRAVTPMHRLSQSEGDALRSS